MTVTANETARTATPGRPPWLAALLVSALPLAGCVTVEAPEKPIVINLNINIKQEVVYRLDGDAKALIDQQGDIF